MTIQLDLNPELQKELSLQYEHIFDITDETLSSTKTLTVTNVPSEIEYEVSKILFNRLDIIEKRKENEQLMMKILTREFSHLMKNNQQKVS